MVADLDLRGTSAAAPSGTAPFGAAPSDAEGASQAFAALLGARRRASWEGTAPGDLVGLEHEFVVRDATRVIDFRQLILDVPLDGRRLDPGDVNAVRCSWGGVVTADGAEAEVATPPVPRRPGFVDRLDQHARTAAIALSAALPAGVALSGYSTHLSVAMPFALTVPAAQLFAATFAPGLMLLTDRADSPGLLIRPRSGRLEVGVEYVTGRHLRAAIAYMTGAALAVGRFIRERDSSLPPELDVDAVATADRVGWGLRRTAFGDDLLRDGRRAVLRVGANRVSAQEHLEASWTVARAALGRSASEADVAAADALVFDGAPLPIEDDAPAFVVASGSDAEPGARSSAAAARSPFGAILEPRRRGGLTIDAEIATWDTTIFSIAGRGRTAYAAVPRAALERFLRRLDRGELDDVLAAYLAAPVTTPPRTVSGWAAALQPGLFDAAAPATAFIAPEAVYRDVATADVVGDRVGKTPPPGQPVKPDEPGKPRKPDRPGTTRWILLGGGIILILLIVGGLILGGNTQATPTPPPNASNPVVIGPTPTPSIPTETVGPPPCDVAGVVSELFGGAPVDGATLCPRIVDDGSGDEVEYDGTPAKAQQPIVDIVQSGLWSMMLTPDQAAAIAARCGSANLHCAETKPAAGTYVVYVMVLGALIAEAPNAFWEGGIGFLDATPPKGTSTQPYDGAPADVLTGDNIVYTLRTASGQGTFGPFRLGYGGPQQFFSEQPSGAFTYTSGSTMLGFIPAAEWDGARDYRFFTYFSTTDNQTRAVDEAPNFNQPATPAGTLPLVAAGG